MSKSIILFHFESLTSSTDKLHSDLLSLFPTHTHSHSLSQSLTHSRSLSLTHSLSLPLTHLLTYLLTPVCSLSKFFSLSLDSIHSVNTPDAFYPLPLVRPLLTSFLSLSLFSPPFFSSSLRTSFSHLPPTSLPFSPISFHLINSFLPIFLSFPSISSILPFPNFLQGVN